MQVTRGLQLAWRRRELSGDQRAGAWARRRSRDAYVRVIRRTWKVFLVVGLGSAALGGACLWLISNVVARSYAAGLLTATILGTLAYQVTQMAGTSAVAMGEIAEQWTAQELRKLRRHGWRVVNHVLLRTWDIDHVLVGPGGVFAVETKWSAQPWELKPPGSGVARAVWQVSGNARDLSLWQPIKAAGAGPARGVVVLWGPPVQDGVNAERARLDDVEVVTGRAIDEWRTSLPSSGLTESQVEACWGALESQVRLRDSLGGAPPDSVWTIVIRYLTALAAALVAFVATADLLTLVNSYEWWPVVYAVTTGIGAAGMRLRVLRPYAVGWLVGVGTTAVAAVAIIISRVG